jgi:Xaa-Pro dipeptidase
VRDERTERTVGALQSVGADWALLTSVEAVCYASGHQIPIELGPSPHAGGPSTAIVAKDGFVALVVQNLEEEDARASRAGMIRSYESFGPTSHGRSLQEMYVHAVASTVRELGLRGVVAVEPATLPVSLRDHMASLVSAFVDVSPKLSRMRATKTPEEVEQLRYCAEITATGQCSVVEAADIGRSELEVFADVRRAMEAAAGGVIPIGVDLLSGTERTAAAMGSPTLRRLETGDPVLCDLVPRVNGYWGDSCNTFVLGSASLGLLELRDVVVRALELAAELIRPGIKAGDLDSEVRRVISDAQLHNPLHVGHGIGVANFEYPRIVPGEPALLEPDMVLMVEPGAYLPGVGGVRLEWMFHVTERGNEVLSPFRHTLSRSPTPSQGGAI